VATLRQEQAKRALSNYELKKAIEPLQKALDADPTDVDSGIMLARIYLDSGKLSKAADILAKVTSIAPSDMRLFAARVDMAIARNEVGSAKQQVEEQSEPYMNFRYGRVMKARVARESGAPGDLAELKGVAERNPKFFEAAYELAMSDAAAKAPNLSKRFEDLVAMARMSGRPAMATVLQACAVTYGKNRGMAQQVAADAEAEENGRALLILAKGEIDAKNNKGAAELLTKAKSFSDMPEIDALLQKVGG
jgi:thioredoxin-like negative regulator of GroEL